MYNNFEISLVVFMPNITTNHAITYTNRSVFNYYNYLDRFKCPHAISRDSLVSVVLLTLNSVSLMVFIRHQRSENSTLITQNSPANVR